MSGEEFFVVSDSSVVFQLRFGLKQDRPGHASPPICFALAPDETLCLVHHTCWYLELAVGIPSCSNLFVTSVPLHGAATHITLCQWFAHVLRESGVSAPPASSHSPVASCASSQGLSPNTIVAVDWSSFRTLFQNYIHLLPASALQRAGEGTIQDVLSINFNYWCLFLIIL